MKDTVDKVSMILVIAAYCVVIACAFYTLWAA